MTSTVQEIVELFIDAYNGGDDTTLLSLCHDEICVTHHNRDVVINGKDNFAGVLTAFKSLVPDKHFFDRRALFISDNNVIVEHCWGATATDDVPGFACKGETIKLDLCTRYTIENSLVVEYHDYG